jgi:hypothetical protein
VPLRSNVNWMGAMPSAVDDYRRRFSHYRGLRGQIHYSEAVGASRYRDQKTLSRDRV